MKQFRLFGTIINDDSERWSMDDVNPSQFQAFLRNVPEGEPVELMINSPGGSVTAGLAIANMIKTAKQPITARVYGIAASMASVIACAAPTLAMFRSSFMMVHNPWGLTIGNAEELRKTADVLDSMRDACIGIYASKFPSLKAEELQKLMSEETWMLGSELSAYGLECTIEDDPAQMAACVTGPAMFAKIPDGAKRFYAGVPDLKPLAPPADHSAELAALQQEHAALQARFSGLQSAKDRELAALKETHAAELKTLTEAHAAAVNDFKGQLATLQTGLDSARAELSAANEAKAKADADLALKGEQLQSALEAHAKLTGAALKPTEAFSSWSAAEQAVGYAQARKQYPELYAAFMAGNRKG